AEETFADLWATGTSGTHPVAHIRKPLTERGVIGAAELKTARPGAAVVVAGLITHRQQPGTARGVVFLSLEDETGMANVICPPPAPRGRAGRPARDGRGGGMGGGGRPARPPAPRAAGRGRRPQPRFPLSKPRQPAARSAPPGQVSPRQVSRPRLDQLPGPGQPPRARSAPGQVSRPGPRHHNHDHASMIVIMTSLYTWLRQSRDHVSRPGGAQT